MQRFVWCSYHIPDVPDELQNVEWMTKDVGNPGERFVITEHGDLWFTERGDGNFVRKPMTDFTGEIALHRNAVEGYQGYDLWLEIDRGKLSMIRCIGRHNYTPDLDWDYESVFDVHVHGPVRVLEAIKSLLSEHRFMDSYDDPLDDDFFYHCRAFLKDPEVLRPALSDLSKLQSVYLHAWFHPRDETERVDMYFGEAFKEHVTE